MFFHHFLPTSDPQDSSVGCCDISGFVMSMRKVMHGLIVISVGDSIWSRETTLQRQLSLAKSQDQNNDVASDWGGDDPDIGGHPDVLDPQGAHQA